MIKKTIVAFTLLTLILLPVEAWEGMNLSMDQATTSGFGSNSVGDIAYMDLPGGGCIIWVGTGRGLSKSTDGGATWVTYNQSSGLNHNDISALAITDTTLWVATAYSKVVEGESIPYGRGFNKTEDFGQSWESFIPWQVDFAGMLAYDIAIDDTTVWAATWYGGLIRSQDGGQTWENVFVDSAAQADFEEGRFLYLNNRFFAVVVDTSCPTGKKQKNSINDIHHDGKIIWVATENGLQGSLDMGETWFPKDTLLGLNSNGVYCLGGDSSSLWVGLYEEEETYPLPILPSITGADFNNTTDNGFTWNTSRPDQGQASSLDKFPLDIALADTVVWAACAEGGLIRSFDQGETWDNVFPDTSAQRRFEEEDLQYNDIFLSLAIDTTLTDTSLIWAGTKNGIYKFVYTTRDTADTVIQYLYQQDPVVILSVGIQHHHSGTTVWACGYELIVLEPFPVMLPVTYRTTDGGQSWIGTLENVQARDFAFLDSVVWVATNEGLKRSTNGGESWETFEVIDSSSGQLIIPSRFQAVEVVQDIADTIIFAGSVDGLARSKDDGITWEVTKFAHSFRKAVWAGSAAGIYKFIYNYRDDFDTVLNYNSFMHNITGDWVVSLAVQHYDGEKIIWAGTQPAYSGSHGASYSTDDGDSWNTTLEGDRVWNFAFDDTVLWAATSEGLKRSDDWGEDWQVFSYMKDKDEITENRIFSSEFSSVAIIDGEVWAGNADGLVISGDGGMTWDLVRTAVPIGSKGSETAYAYPSPFSPVVEGGQVVRIHHKPRQDGAVTIKIYDFAMNLVITLLDGQQRLGGVEYDEPWDGKNEKGYQVANGVYFFKVEAAGGQSEWGKLVILK
jgi:photosystem II stability/assembly factor-like uncharacterized protein